jgi:hypothetical protein
MFSTSWISESEACALLGYTSCERFRRNVKTQKIAIRYRSTLGRNYQYDARDIKKYQDATVWVSATRKPKTVDA